MREAYLMVFLENIWLILRVTLVPRDGSVALLGSELLLRESECSVREYDWVP